MVLSERFRYFLTTLKQSPSDFIRLFRIRLFKEFSESIQISDEFQAVGVVPGESTPRCIEQFMGILGSDQDIEEIDLIISDDILELLFAVATELGILDLFNIITVLSAYLNTFVQVNGDVSVSMIFSEECLGMLRVYDVVELLTEIVSELYSQRVAEDFAFETLLVSYCLSSKQLLNEDHEKGYDYLQRIKDCQCQETIISVGMADYLDAESLECLLAAQQGKAINYHVLQKSLTEVVQQYLENQANPANQREFVSVMENIRYIQTRGQCPEDVWHKVYSDVALNLSRECGQAYFYDLDASTRSQLFEGGEYQAHLFPEFTEYVNRGKELELLRLNLDFVLKIVEESPGYKEYYENIYQRLLRPVNTVGFFSSPRESLLNILYPIREQARHLFDSHFGLVKYEGAAGDEASAMPGLSLVN